MNKVCFVCVGRFLQHILLFIYNEFINCYSFVRFLNVSELSNSPKARVVSYIGVMLIVKNNTKLRLRFSILAENAVFVWGFHQ